MRYFEGSRAGQAIVWEVNANYCRENLVIADSGEGIEPGTVLMDEDGDFLGMIIHGLDPEETDVQAAAIVRGPAELRGPKMVFPTVTAADGADAGSDNAAETEAATAAKRTALIAQMAERLILIR